MVVAKGWTIVRRKISAMGRVRIACYLAALCGLLDMPYLPRVCIEAATMLYMFDTTPGYVLAFMRIVCFCGSAVPSI